MTKKPAFMNFTVDHMTLLLSPRMYNVAYCAFRILFGTTPDDLLYEKRRKNGSKEVSMTFATRIGQWAKKDENLHTVVAVVQPSEPEDQPSHVRQMLEGGKRSAHWQHIALRTPDLISFHKHCLDRGVNFVTPILKDEHENLIQVFSGEWNVPGGRPSGMFFEFLQRDPSTEEVARVQRETQQTWFRDQTFLGLYDEKEREYQSGKVLPFIPDDLFMSISEKLGGRQVWDISEKDLAEVEEMMLAFGQKRANS